MKTLPVARGSSPKIESQLPFSRSDQTAHATISLRCTLNDHSRLSGGIERFSTRRISSQVPDRDVLDASSELPSHHLANQAIAIGLRDRLGGNMFTVTPVP